MGNPKVQVEITGDTKGLFEALGKSSGALKGFANQVEAHTAGLGKIVNNLKAPLIALAGVVGGGAFLKGTVEETKNWTVEAMKLSKTLGISTEEASVLNLAIGDIYGSMDEFLPVVTKLTKTLNADESAFTRLGVATRDSQGNLRPTVAIMQDVNSKLAGMKSGTDRNIESQRIYGRGWLEIQKYLNLTTAVMEEARAKAEKLNLIVGADSVQATKDYRASVNELDDTMQGLKIRIGSELMPVLTAFNNDLAENGPTAVGAMSGAIRTLYEVLYALQSQTEISLARIDWFFDETVLKAKYSWQQLKALATGHFKEAEFLEIQYNLKSTLRAQELIDDEAAILDKYAGKAQVLMGLAPKKAGANEGDAAGEKAHKDAKPKANVYAEELARIEKDRGTVGANLNATAKEEAEWRKLQADHEERLAKWVKAVQAGSLKPGEARELASQSAALLEAQEKALRAKASQEEDDQNQGLFEIRKERKQAHQIALLDMDKADIQRRKDLGQISASQAILQMEDLEEKRYQIERQGLLDRLAVQTLEIKERAKVISQLKALEDKRQAGREEGGSQFSTARHTETEQTTVKGGVQAQIKENRRALQQWGNLARDVMGGVENAFATGVKGILSGQMSLGQGLKAIWSGIADTILNTLAQIAAKYVVTALANAIFGTETAAVSNTVASAHEVAAAAGFFEAYAAIPYVGLALAEGNIAVMEATMGAMRAKQVVGAAEGGWFDRPTFAMIGEGKRPELVVPDTSFKDFARNLTSNILAQERQTQAYRLQAASYARHPRADVPVGQQIHNYAGATIVATNSRQWEDMVAKGQHGYDRRKN